MASGKQSKRIRRAMRNAGKDINSGRMLMKKSTGEVVVSEGRSQLQKLKKLVTRVGNTKLNEGGNYGSD